MDTFWDAVESVTGPGTSNNATGLSSDEDDVDGASEDEAPPQNDELDEEAAHAASELCGDGASALAAMEAGDFMGSSERQASLLCSGLLRALADTAGSGCGPRCTSSCLNIFCQQNPTKANALYAEGVELGQKYAEGYSAFGQHVIAASIRSTGLGSKARNTNNGVKTLSVASSSTSSGHRPTYRRLDFFRTGKAARRVRLQGFGYRELPALMRPADEGGAGVCGYAAAKLIGATSAKAFYTGPLAQVFTDENLRSYGGHGDRVARGLAPLYELANPEAGNECCSWMCLKQLGERALECLWQPYEEAGDDKRSQDLAALNGGYFNPAICRASSLCACGKSELYGHGESRRTGLNHATSLLVGGDVKDPILAQASMRHGNIGRVPANATPAESTKLMVRALEAATINDPANNVLHVTQTAKLGGFKQLALEILSTLPEGEKQRAAVTIVRFIKKYCKDRGIKGLCVHKSEHNACPLCFFDRAEMTKSAKVVVLLQHRVDDTRVAFAAITGGAPAPSLGATAAAAPAPAAVFSVARLQNGDAIEVKLADVWRPATVETPMPTLTVKSKRVARCVHAPKHCFFSARFSIPAISVHPFTFPLYPPPSQRCATT